MECRLYIVDKKLLLYYTFYHYGVNYGVELYQIKFYAAVTL